MRLGVWVSGHGFGVGGFQFRFGVSGLRVRRSVEDPDVDLITICYAHPIPFRASKVNPSSRDVHFGFGDPHPPKVTTFQEPEGGSPQPPIFCDIYIHIYTNTYIYIYIYIYIIGIYVHSGAYLVSGFGQS